MLSKNQTRRLLSLGVMLSTSALMLLLCAPTANAIGRSRPKAPPASAESSGRNITVTVSGSGYTQGQGGSAGSGGGRSTSVSVPATCWMDPYLTGTEYYEYVESGAWAAETSSDTDPDPWQGYATHKDDKVGRWYSGTCLGENWPGQSDLTGFFEFTDRFWAANPPRFVPASEDPPQAPVPPEQLREIAIEHLTLPRPELDWNPKRTGSEGTLVNLDTWFWLDSAPAPTLQVTAAARGTEATVVATFGGMTVSAPGEAPLSCGDSGTPYTPGANSTCTLAFSRASSALGRPATPVSVKTRWAASWFLNDRDQGLITPQPSQSSVTTDIRVDEVQTLVTGAR